jgi:hypothetical protein
MRRLPKTAGSSRSSRVSITRTSAYSAVPTPNTMRKIVKTLPLADSGSTSRNPTVVTVVTVW